MCDVCSAVCGVCCIHVILYYNYYNYYVCCIVTGIFSCGIRSGQTVCTRHCLPLTGLGTRLIQGMRLIPSVPHVLITKLIVSVNNLYFV